MLPIHNHSQTGTDSSLPRFPTYFRRQIKRSLRLRCRVPWWGPAQLPNTQFVPILCPLPQGCNTFPDFKRKSLLPLQPEPEHALPGTCLAREPASTSTLEVSQAKYSTNTVLPALQHVTSPAVLFASARSMLQLKPLPGLTGGTWLDTAHALSCPSAWQIPSSHLFPGFHAGMEFSGSDRSCRQDSSIDQHRVLAITSSLVYSHHSAPPLPL